MTGWPWPEQAVQWANRKPTVNLSLEQQEHVIDALYFLRVKFESWKPTGLERVGQCPAGCAPAAAGVGGVKPPGACSPVFGSTFTF